MLGSLTYPASWASASLRSVKVSRSMARMPRTKVSNSLISRVGTGETSTTHESLHELRMEQRERHGHLAAHRVADHGVLISLALSLQQLGDLARHLGIGEVIRPGGLAVIGQVNQRDPGGCRSRPWRSCSSSFPVQTGRGETPPAVRWFPVGC